MRMHVGFSFKPKTILIILGVLFAVLAACVEAFADDSTPTDIVTPTDAGTTVIVQAVPLDTPTAPDTYTYNRGSHSGLAAAVDNVFGSYMPLMQVDSSGNVSVVSGLAGVDFSWCGGCLAFLILFYSFFRLLGGVFLGKSK